MCLALQVRADSALRGIGRPVGGVPGRGRPTCTQNPVARVFSQTAGKAARHGDGGLLSGHVSSTEAAEGAQREEGTPPRTAAEALAAMQSRLAAESPSTKSEPTDFSKSKAPETQVSSPLASRHLMQITHLKTRPSNAQVVLGRKAFISGKVANIWNSC